MSEYVKVAEIFGQDVFNDSVMEERLPKKVYKELKRRDSLHALVSAFDRIDR